MEHPRIIAAGAIALAVTLFAIFSMRPWARKVGLVDRPDTRKQHSGRVPLVGGICFFIGMLVGLSYLGYLDRFVMSLLMGSALIVAVGVADDVVNLSVRTRLFTESAIVGLVILSTGYYIDHLGGLLPGSDFRLGIWGIPLTIFAVIGLINAFNMLDGIDGLATSVAMVCIASVLLYDRAGWALVGVMFMLQILFAALIPYILVNLGWPDGRKIFMGDAGSTVIGFLLGWSLIYLSHSRVGRLAPVDVLWCVALPVLDTLAVMYRRMRLGRSPFSADRQHLHHLLIDVGFSRGATLSLMVGGAAMLATLGYALRGAPDIVNLLVFIAVASAYVLGLPQLIEMRRRGFAWRPNLLRGARPSPDRPPPLGHHRLSNEDHEPYPLTEPATPLRTLCVVAATLESIGVAPIAQRLANDDRFDSSVCLSDMPGVDGEAALRLFGLQADGRLTGDGNGDAMVAGVRELFQQMKPDVVLVPANAPATFALSLAAHADEVPVVCIDADTPSSTPSHWPNDASRRIVQSLAALHIATSEGTGQRLREEGIPPERVLVDDAITAHALRTGLDRLRAQNGLDRSLAQRFPFLREGSPMLLVLGAPSIEESGSLGEALEMISRRRPDVDVLWPVAQPISDATALEPLRAFANVHIVEMVDYLSWVHLLDRARLVLAGRNMPCEGRLLGKPVLLARDEPEVGSEASGCIVIGSTALAIAGRVLTLLSEPDAYQSVCAAVSATATPPERGDPLPEVLLRLRSNDDNRGEPGEMRYAYGVREAS